MALTRGTKKIFKLLAIIAAFAVFAYIVILPWVAERIAGMIPVSLEKQLGSIMYDGLVSGYKVDKEKSNLANDFFNAMDYGSEKGYEYNITVVRSREVNAFAIPAGDIVVYSNLLDKMQDYNEFVALLSHEYAHIEKRHSLKAIFRELSGYVVISFMFGGWADIVHNVQSLGSLQYSRKAEKEADIYGLEMMREQGYNLDGMLQLMNTLKSDESDDESKVFEFASTHPLLKSRIKYINKYIDEHAFQQRAHYTLDSIWTLIKEE